MTYLAIFKYFEVIFAESSQWVDSHSCVRLLKIIGSLTFFIEDSFREVSGANSIEAYMHLKKAAIVNVLIF
jgi:hypothetical protein